MNPFLRLWTTFVWQPVPDWPRVRWRGFGSPDNAGELIAEALSGYQQAYLARTGTNPPPIVGWVWVVFDAAEKTGHGNKADNNQDNIAISTKGRSRDEIIRLIGHERLHTDRDRLTGDPDHNHDDIEGWRDIPQMMTNPDHPGWERGAR